jgi:hypothetical protein
MMNCVFTCRIWSHHLSGLQDIYVEHFDSTSKLQLRRTHYNAYLRALPRKSCGTLHPDPGYDHQFKFELSQTLI